MARNGAHSTEFILRYFIFVVFCVVVLSCLYVSLEFLRYNLADELESNEGCQAIGVICC